MAKIEVSIDYDQDRTVFQIIGPLNPGELLESVRNYNEGQVTKLVLVDCTRASWTGLSTTELKENIAKASRYSNEGGRTAFVFSNAADFGVGRMIEAFAAIEKYRNVFRMFRSIDEANSWLRSDTES